MPYDMRNAFPSRFLKASDIPEPIICTIQNVLMEDVAPDPRKEEIKPILVFEEKIAGKQEKVLNKTNTDVCMGAFGWNSDEWAMRKVRLYVEQVMYQGKMVPGLRLSIPEAGAPAQAQPAAPSRDEELIQVIGPNGTLLMMPRKTAANLGFSEVNDQGQAIDPDDDIPI